MKTAVIIISVAALLLLLCISRLHFSFESMDGTTLSLRFLFIKFRLYPKKQKKIRLSDYSLKKAKKQKKKSDSKKIRGKKKASKEDDSKGKSSSGVEPDFKSFLISCLKTVVKDFPKRVRTERLILNLTISGKDAAATALKFGAAHQFASLLCGVIDKGMPMKNTKRRSISISPDYTGEKDEYKVKITLSIALGSIIVCAGKILAAYVSTMKAE